MREKSSIEMLEDYAKQRGIEFLSNSIINDFLLIPNERFLNTKLVVFNLNPICQDMIMVFYDTFSPKAYSGKTYCGLFKKLSNCNIEINISKRSKFDWLSFKKYFKPSSSFVNDNISVIIESKEFTPMFLNTEFAKKFIELYTQIPGIELNTKLKMQSAINDLNGKDMLVLQTNFWVTNHHKLDFFIKNGIELLNITKLI